MASNPNAQPKNRIGGAAQVNALYQQIMHLPASKKLEAGAAMATDPSPAIRRVATSVVRMALTELEAQEAKQS